MFRSFLLSLLLTSSLFFSQSKEEITYYSQNNTGFPMGTMDFDIDNTGNFYLAHVYRDKLNPGGITFFDGIHWKLTTQNDNNFPYISAWNVAYSKYDGSVYVYGSILHSDVSGQRYGIVRLNPSTNTWQNFGDTTVYPQGGGLDFLRDDMLIDENGDLFIASSNGFYKLTETTATRYTLPDNPYFAASQITFDNNGGVFIARNWTDGWVNPYTGLYYFDGNAVDTLVDPFDSINFISDMKVDDSGALWCLVNNNGSSTGYHFLMRYSEGNVSFFHFPNEYHIHDKMALDDNKIWLYADGKLIKFDIATHNYDVFNFFNPLNPYGYIIVKKMLPFGNYLYVFNNNGPLTLLAVNKSNGSIDDYLSVYNTGLAGTDIMGIRIAPNKHYWFYSLNLGISEFNGDSWRSFSSFDINGQNVVGTYDMAVTPGNTIITVSDSVRVWDRTQGWNSYLPPEDLTSGGILGVSVVAPNDNIAWIADENHGLLKFNLQTYSFSLYEDDETGGNGPHKLFIDKDGNLWIGFRYSTPTYYDGSQFHHFTENDGVYSFTTDITQAPDGSIWMSFANNGIAKYSNGSWTSFTPNNSSLPFYSVQTIDVDNNGGIWIAPVSYDTLSVYYSNDNCETWQKIVLDPEINNGVSDITIDENNNVFVSTYSNGVFVYNLNQIVLGTENENSNNVSDFKLLQNYPNPFNPTTTIEYSIPFVGTKKFSPLQNVQLKIYDVLGREIATLVNEKQSPGNYSVQFNASSLPSGIYFYTLRVGNFVATKKMILMK